MTSKKSSKMPTTGSTEKRPGKRKKVVPPVHEDAGAKAAEEAQYEPLVRQELRDGRLTKSNAITNAFWRLLQKTGIDGGRGFYCLRKTGASLIEVIDPLATEMYLSHSERGMKRNYAQRDWARLERATEAMSEQVKDVLK
ncbi:MAG: hypothetical protein WCK05_03410 [Planctomycetota bacterium]